LERKTNKHKQQKISSQAADAEKKKQQQYRRKFSREYRGETIKKNSSRK
jgi:hypothetical protein